MLITKCYGDFFEKQSQDNQLRSSLNDQEYEEYKQYSAGNKNRLMKECQISVDNMDIKPKQNNTKQVSGIGEVQQIY